MSTEETMGTDNHFQLIDERGNFKEGDLQKFVNNVELADSTTNYLVISILGPQSSGKSTLMNYIFRTKFEIMQKRRKRTTKGVWVDGCKFNGKTAILMDLEGSDGRERGEDDTLFERQIAFFAFVLSNVNLVNMWYHDFGRENAAGKPLIRIIFEEKVKLFRDSDWTTTLLLCIRDTDPDEDLENVEMDLKNDLEKLWNSVQKPDYYRGKQFRDFFEVEVIFFPNLKYRREEFERKVEEMKENLGEYLEGGNVLRVRGSLISGTWNDIWNEIKENESLDMPSMRILVAEKHCGENREKIFECLKTDENLSRCEREAGTKLSTSFGRQAKEIMENYLARYDKETELLEDEVRSNNKDKLREQILQFFHGMFKEIVASREKLYLSEFKSNFSSNMTNYGSIGGAADHYGIKPSMEKFEASCADANIECLWDASQVVHEVKDSIKSEAVTIMENYFKEQLEKKIEGELNKYLDAANVQTWRNIRQLLERVLKEYEDELSVAFGFFEIDEEAKKQQLDHMKDAATTFVELKAKQETRDRTILPLLSDRQLINCIVPF